MPSKEELEAATNCMEQFMFAPHELPLADDLHQQYRQMAEQTLVVAEHERWKRTKTGPTMPAFNATYLPFERQLFLSGGSNSSQDYREVTLTGPVVFRFAESGELLGMTIINTPPILSAATLGRQPWHDTARDGRGI